MMMFGGSGLVANRLHVCGIPWSPVYLLDGERPLLFESGFTCTWKIATEMIRSVLKKRKPALLLLTHVHWDHCGAAGYLKRSFSGMEIGASRRGAEIMKRPNAVALITDLNAQVTANVAALSGGNASRLSSEPFLPFNIDVTIEDGDVVDFGTDMRVQALATPGHTRDHMSYYVPARKLLIATEACGCIDRTGHLITEFLVDYDAYLASLERLSMLPIEILCQGHHFVISGAQEIKDFFVRSMGEAKAFQEKVYELLDAEKGDAERVIARIKAEQYDTNHQVKQLEQAYLLNVRAQVAHLAARKKASS